MVKYININLKAELPIKEISKLTNLLEPLPLVFQGAHIDDYLASEDNPATMEVLKDMDSGLREFILQPVKGDKIICWIDDYLLDEKKFKCPKIKMNPGYSKDPRPVLEIESSLENESYRISIFPRAIGD